MNLNDPVLALQWDADLHYEDLTDSYQYIDDDNENVKAKKWSKGKQERIYFRVRRHDDRRKFREFYVEMPIQDLDDETQEGGS